ncbi:hypothetical protein ACSBR1_007874 [Camellia fascicularis]
MGIMGFAISVMYRVHTLRYGHACYVSVLLSQHECCNQVVFLNDIDMDNMVCLAMSFRLDHIDVIIQSRMTQVQNTRAGSKLMSDVISKRVRDRLLTRPTDVVYDVNKDYGLEISYRVAWLGVVKACGEMFGAHFILFDQLRSYSNAVMDNNPGNYINIDHDEQNHRFERFFISCKACIDGFNHCRPLLFLDGTFLKGKFKGNLLATSAKDGNQGWTFLLHT